MSQTPRMTEQELQEVHRRMRISKSKTGTVRTYKPRTSIYKSKLEARYAAHLDMLVKAGEIKRWEYECLSLRLADGRFYRPDFLVVLPGGLERKPEIHETKGRFTKNRRAGILKLEWAAQKYGDVFTFRLIEWTGHGFSGSYVVEP